MENLNKANSTRNHKTCKAVVPDTAYIYKHNDFYQSAFKF